MIRYGTDANVTSACSVVISFATACSEYSAPWSKLESDSPPDVR
ncbi:MAG: hypothetical protein ABSG43_22920 [Solirubrobacteraceae bacterium]|jgi:hypothetical protein